MSDRRFAGKFGIGRPQIKRRGRLIGHGPRHRQARHPERVGLADIGQREIFAQCCAAPAVAPVPHKRARTEGADARHRFVERHHRGRENRRALFPQQQIGLVALGVVDRGGAIRAGRRAPWLPEW